MNAIMSNANIMSNTTCHTVYDIQYIIHNTKYTIYSIYTIQSKPYEIQHIEYTIQNTPCSASRDYLSLSIKRGEDELIIQVGWLEVRQTM